MLFTFVLKSFAQKSTQVAQLFYEIYNKSFISSGHLLPLLPQSEKKSKRSKRLIRQKRIRRNSKTKKSLKTSRNTRSQKHQNSPSKLIQGGTTSLRKKMPETESPLVGMRQRMNFILSMKIWTSLGNVLNKPNKKKLKKFVRSTGKNL